MAVSDLLHAHTFRAAEPENDSPTSSTVGALTAPLVSTITLGITATHNVLLTAGARMNTGILRGQRARAVQPGSSRPEIDIGSRF